MSLKATETESWTTPEETAELVLEYQGWVRRVPLGQKPVVLGRTPECDVVIPDLRLSRSHCRILASAQGGWRVEDLGSRHGSFVAGVRVEGTSPLRPGEVLQIGETRVMLRPALPRASIITGDPERDGRNLDLLLSTVAGLAESQDLDALLRSIVDRAILVAGADRGALLLAGTGPGFKVRTARDAGGRDLSAEGLFSRSLPEKALQTGRAVLLRDTSTAESGHETPDSVIASGLRSVACIPLPGPDRVSGILYLDSSRPAEAFSQADLSLLECLAVHSALAIERAQMREERRRRESRAREGLESSNAALKARLGAERPIGESRLMLQTLDRVRKVAASDATVCLLGETGTGKEVLARHLHRLSPRAAGPFVVVDCAAIPEGLIESELFGHERGAFTGALESRPGSVREAEGGTLFLDEIGELPLALQTRLLRLLQERSVQPVGASARIPVEVRVVCATHRDLPRLVEAGRFREDLYYRLAVLTVPIPALRERGEDVLLLAHHFLARFGAAYGNEVHGFTQAAREALLAHAWPGNVRELERRVQRAALLARPPFATRQDLELGEAEDEGLPAFEEARSAVTQRFERVYIRQVLEHSRGNVSRAAELAGVSRQFFQRLLRRYEIDRLQFTGEAIEKSGRRLDP
jgi:Nif-specific regulatory protein